MKYVNAEQIQTELNTLVSEWEQLTDVPENPSTTLQIIEYSLEKQRKAETYASRILAYFVDPSKPHGLGDEFLTAFLNSFPTEMEFDEDTFELTETRVKTEAPISRTREDVDENVKSTDTQVRGYIDLFIDVPEEWFLVCELKFGADERGVDSEGLSQTERYYAANQVNGESKADYSSGQYYLYIRPQSANPATEDEFTTLSWQHVVVVIESFLTSNAVRLPSRSVHQLREFKDDIEILTGMSEQEQHTQNLAALYVDHFDAVRAVSEAFENQWNTFMGAWWQQLSSQLESEPGISDWHGCEGNDWAYIFKHGWWRHAETLEPVHEKGDYNTIRIGFHHRMINNRETALRDNKLLFYFRNPPPNRHSKWNDTNFRDMFNAEFEARKNTIQDELPVAASLTGNKRNLTVASYVIPVDEHEDFPSAYLQTVERAFREHALENQALVEELNNIFEKCLSDSQQKD